MLSCSQPGVVHAACVELQHADAGPWQAGCASSHEWQVLGGLYMLQDERP